MLAVLVANGVDRVFLVPGESYLGLLDALNDFPQLGVITCRHEAGAGFMACADGRLSGRPALVMVSRGPGATNAAIAVHTAQQDAIPLILVIGQVPAGNLRKEAFQEIDYQKMYAPMAKWVFEATDPARLAEMAFKAVRVATSGTPGPVVLVVPEDIQQQPVPLRQWTARTHVSTMPTADVIDEVRALIDGAQRPLIIAGGVFERLGGREALLAFAEAVQIPVAVSFRRHDVFPNDHPLFAGDLGLSNPEFQLDAFHSSDLILALGTRIGDITSQGYTFPRLPDPAQAVVHCYPDAHPIGLHFVPRLGIVCDTVALTVALTPAHGPAVSESRRAWLEKLRALHARIARWPDLAPQPDGINFSDVVRALSRQAPRDAMVCLDAGSFAAPVYRNFGFVYPQRLLSPISGAMGYGTPAAIAAQLRCPDAKVICMVGDGGFMMTGNEMIAAFERKLPILFIVANNNAYGSIRIHQDINYPGRHAGTTLCNPDFTAIAKAFGIQAETIDRADQIEGALRRGIGASTPYLLHVVASLAAILPARGD